MININKNRKHICMTCCMYSELFERNCGGSLGWIHRGHIVYKNFKSMNIFMGGRNIIYDKHI